MINELFTIKDVDKSKAQEKFASIASELFEHCVIKQDEVTFKFLEVEFYFWTKSHQDDINEDGKQKPFVYPRYNAQPAQYLIHSSGMDLCLKSDNGYGGILIRSLLRIDSNKGMSIVTGPWDCCDALINYTGGINNVFPKLEYVEKSDPEVELEVAVRCNVPQKCTLKDAKYCFYNKEYIYKGCKWGYKDEPLKRYNPYTRELVDNTYSAKPWNRDK